MRGASHVVLLSLVIVVSACGAEGDIGDHATPSTASSTPTDSDARPTRTPQPVAESTVAPAVVEAMTFDAIGDVVGSSTMSDGFETSWTATWSKSTGMLPVSQVAYQFPLCFAAVPSDVTVAGSNWVVEAYRIEGTGQFPSTNGVEWPPGGGWLAELSIDGDTTNHYALDFGSSPYGCDLLATSPAGAIASMGQAEAAVTTTSPDFSLAVFYLHAITPNEPSPAPESARPFFGVFDPSYGFSPSCGMDPPSNYTCQTVAP